MKAALEPSSSPQPTTWRSRLRKPVRSAMSNSIRIATSTRVNMMCSVYEKDHEGELRAWRCEEPCLLICQVTNNLYASLGQQAANLV